jgi:hypothetical protein
MSHSIHRIAYSVTDLPSQNGERRNRWHAVGVSFLNKDGSETVLLDATPLSGKLILQVPKSESPGSQTQQPEPASDDEETFEL